MKTVIVVILLVSFMAVNAAKAAGPGEKQAVKILLETLAKSAEDTEASAVADQSEIQSRPAIFGGRARLKSIACAEMKASIATSLLSVATALELLQSSDSLKASPAANSLGKSLQSFLDHSKAAIAACRDLPNAIREIRHTKVDLTAAAELVDQLP